VFIREHPTVGWSLVQKEGIGRLQQAIEASFRLDPLSNDWSFDERQSAEVLADLAEIPDQVAGIDPALDVRVLAPEGRFDGSLEDRWSVLLRLPNRRELCSLGHVFRPKSLRQEIFENFFGFRQIDERRQRSFIPGKHGADKPPHLRALLVRPAWRGRALCPNDFPALHVGPVIGEAAQAKYISKLGQSKSRVRREKHQQNLLRFRAEAEARRAVREQEALQRPENEF
jgi:hypothetical protein